MAQTADSYIVMESSLEYSSTELLVLSTAARLKRAPLETKARIVQKATPRIKHLVEHLLEMRVEPLHAAELVALERCATAINLSPISKHGRIGKAFVA